MLIVPTDMGLLGPLLTVVHIGVVVNNIEPVSRKHLLEWPVGLQKGLPKSAPIDAWECPHLHRELIVAQLRLMQVFGFIEVSPTSLEAYCRTPPQRRSKGR